MRIRAVSLALASVCAAPALADCPGGAPPARVEFTGMPAPATADEKADVYTRATLRMTCPDGSATEQPLQYRQIAATAERIGESVVGGLHKADGAPLTDRDGQLASDSPDGTSLIAVEGLAVPAAVGHPLALVTQFEYRELPPNDGTSTGSFWSKLPATVGLTLLDQDPQSGLLTAKGYKAIDFSGVHGGWIHCGATLSAWNTQVGSEEYEPDAKVREGHRRRGDRQRIRWRRTGPHPRADRRMVG
jgi:uncharacterized protein